MMDPIMFTRLGQIRQQEILEQAAADWERPPLIRWSRLLDPIYAYVQRRSRSRRAAFQISTVPQTGTLEECSCE